MTERDETSQTKPPPGEPNGPRPSGSERPDLLRELLESHSGDLRCLELCPICRAADVLRATAPEDLRDGWHGVQREALLTMKSLIDHYVERLDDEGEGPQGPSVEDIPIS